MTPDRNPDVMEFVEKALRENPDASVAALQEQAALIDASVGELSARSFNARYPLQVKRKLARGKEEPGREGADSPEHSESLPSRPQIREVLVEFAQDVVGAPDRGTVVNVVREVDSYVDRILE